MSCNIDSKYVPFTTTLIDTVSLFPDASSAVQVYTPPCSNSTDGTDKSKVFDVCVTPAMTGVEALVHCMELRWEPEETEHERERVSPWFNNSGLGELGESIMFSRGGGAVRVCVVCVCERECASLQTDHRVCYLAYRQTFITVGFMITVVSLVCN